MGWKLTESAFNELIVNLKADYTILGPKRDENKLLIPGKAAGHGLAAVWTVSRIWPAVYPSGKITGPACNSRCCIKYMITINVSESICASGVPM
jgi:hypothetical protein